MDVDTKEALINDFAKRSFRDVADQDYIAARLSYRAALYPQFLWCSQQAIEKYLKCILLLNRVKAKNIRHDLSAALALIKDQCPFSIRLNDESRAFIEYIDTYGRFRYLETPYYVQGHPIVKLDEAVWQLRRYCQVLNYSVEVSPGERKEMLQGELQAIERAENRPPHLFSIRFGLLENINADTRNPARAPLLWNNLYFGRRARKHARLRDCFQAVNSPLSLSPQIVDDIMEYVFFPKEVADEYKKQNANSELQP